MGTPTAEKVYGIEALARLLHESGRTAVEGGFVYAVPSDRKAFCEWDDLPEPARDGRRMMAGFLVSHGAEVIRHLVDGDAFGDMIAVTLDKLLAPVEPSRR